MEITQEIKDQVISEYLENVQRPIDEKVAKIVAHLEGQVEALSKIKVELDIKDKQIISNDQLQWQHEEIERLTKIKKHYETKASSSTTLKHAVTELLTYGLWFSDFPDSQKIAEELNKHLRGQIRTRNYIIQKQVIQSNPEFNNPNRPVPTEDTIYTDETEGQGLIVNKIIASRAKGVTSETFYI